MKSSIKKIMMYVFCLSLGMLLWGCGSNKIMEDKKINVSHNSEITFLDVATWTPYDKEYLKELRKEYKLDELVSSCDNDLDVAVQITEWVTNLWEHDGNNEPEQSDPLYILNQVVNHGEKFRCVEYGIVTNGCLSALGYHARTVKLKTADVETRESGAGHVGCEVYLPEYEKWVWIDSQWGVIPIKNSVPLSAYELGEALKKKDPELDLIKVNNSLGTNKDYYDWIEEYLFYLDTEFLNSKGDVETIMYVPETGKEVAVFQKKYKINITYYLRDINTFYQIPET